MRKILSVALLIVFAFSLVVPTSAQDDGMIACDSTLLTLVLVAEYHYGFESMYDLSTFDKGQLAPLFESMMSMMDDETMTEDPMMEEGEEMREEGEEMMGDTMMLPHGDIEGEPEDCTALRAEVESFLYDHLSAELMMEESM